MKNHMAENDKMTVALTGGTGYIARSLLEHEASETVRCRAVSRNPRAGWASPAIEWATVPSYDDRAGLASAFAGARFVIHLADNASRHGQRHPEEALRNCDALIDVAREAGIEGIVLASSLYARNAATAYGASKRAIEDRFLAATDLKTIILRLPPVYGPGCKGGFAALAKLASKGFPLPLGAARAPRAYLSARNLSSLICAIVKTPEQGWTSAAGRIFEPSDGTGVTTRDLAQMMSATRGRTPLLLPVPPALLRAAGAATGRSELMSSILDRLESAPIGELQEAFGWRPVEQMPASLSFLAQPSRRA